MLNETFFVIFKHRVPAFVYFRNTKNLEKYSSIKVLKLSRFYDWIL